MNLQLIDFKTINIIHKLIYPYCRCIWQCPGQSSYHECHNGKWNNEPGQARCMCHKIGTKHQGQVGYIGGLVGYIGGQVGYIGG